MPSRALNAGSTWPPLAVKTAFTTAASMVGNASFKVFSACCCGDSGLGGFGGAASSDGAVDCGIVLDAGVLSDGDDGAVSSSKSRALAVVGDSGRVSFCMIVSRLVVEYEARWLTGFSESAMLN